MASIWHHTSSPPQQIGTTEGVRPLLGVMDLGREKGWVINAAIRRTNGDVLTFDTVDRMFSWIERNGRDCVAEYAQVAQKVES